MRSLEAKKQRFAIRLPIADDMGLASLAGLFEIGAVGEGVLFAGLDLVSPFVDVSSLIS